MAAGFERLRLRRDFLFPPPPPAGVREEKERRVIAVLGIAPVGRSMLLPATPLPYAAASSLAIPAAPPRSDTT